MFALVSAAITSGAATALAVERSWELQHVRSVGDAVAAMPPERRASIRALIVESEPVGDDLLGQLPELELIACLRSELVNVDVRAATARKIAVVHTPGRTRRPSLTSRSACAWQPCAASRYPIIRSCPAR